VTDQLQKLLDHQSITSLPHVYCDAVIRKDYESLANLFTEDGEFVVPAAAFLGEDEASKGGEDRRYKGREALLAMYEDSIGGGIIPLPSVSDIVYEVNGDVAVGRCVSTVRYANNKAAHFLAFYDDAYARTAEGWKFTRRVVRMMSFDLTHRGRTRLAIRNCMGDSATRADLQISRTGDGELLITSRQDGMIRMLVPDGSPATR